MIASLQGSLLVTTAAYVIVEVQDVGYKVNIPPSTIGKLPLPPGRCRLWIAHIVREQSEALYGFTEQSECALFETLLAVKGIGPKLALNIIGHLPPQAFLKAIDEGDIEGLSRIPGIGKKTGQRLLVELRGKADPSTLGVLLGNAPSPTSAQALAISALINLGYSDATAKRAVQRSLSHHNENDSGSEVDLSTLIATALRQI